MFSIRREWSRSLIGVSRTEKLKNFWSQGLARNTAIVSATARAQFPRLRSLQELEPAIENLAARAESLLAESLSSTSTKTTLAAVDCINGRFPGWLYGIRDSKMHPLHPVLLGMILTVCRTYNRGSELIVKSVKHQERRQGQRNGSQDI